MSKLSYKTLLIILVFLLIPIVFLLRSNLKTTKVLADWWNDSWSYRIPININNTGVGQTNVYVTLTVGTSDTSRFQADGGDIRFTYQNNLLSYFIVNSTTIHVNFPTLPVGNSTIYMYYGNPSAPNGFSAADFSTAASNTTPTPSAEEVGGGPVAYWKFDEGVGTTAYDSTSGKKNGTLGTGNSSPLWVESTQCISGSCLKFDGVSNYVNSNYDFSWSNSEKFSFSFWMKPNTLTGIQGILGKGAAGGYGTGNWEWKFLLSNSTLSFGYFDTGGQNEIDLSTTITNNQWIHVAVTYDPSSKAKFYINGLEVATDSTVVDTFQNRSTPMLFGHSYYSGGTNYYFNGYLDDVKIFSYARTATQIKQDYTSGLAGQSTAKGANTNIGGNSAKSLSDGLVGYWKMDEGIGTSVADSSGNSNIANFGIGSSAPSWSSGKFGVGNSLTGDDFLQVGSTFSTAYNSFTTSAWFKTTTSSDAKILSSSNSFHPLSFLSGRFRVCVTACNWSNNLYNDSQWHFATVVGDTTSIRGYIDGVLLPELTMASSTNVDSKIIRIGSVGADTGSNSPGLYFVGLLDEVRIYNRALNPTEITALYNFSPGPVAYYNFDEGSGSITNDRSGNGNLQTFATGNSAPTFGTGKFGKGLMFTSNQYSTSSLTPNIKNSSLTISTWINTNQSGVQRFFTTSAPNTQFGITGSNQIYVHTQNSAGTDVNTPLVSLPTNCRTGWHFISVTWDTTLASNNVKVYCDGSNIGNANLTNALNGSFNLTSLTLGYATASQSITGAMDEFKIYNYARTQEQILQDMQGSSQSLGKPIAWYKFDEGAGSIANNSGIGGTSFNGTLATGSSSPTWVQGKVSQGLNFNTQQYLSTNTISIPFSSLTLSTWIKPSNLSGWEEIVNGTYSIFKLRLSGTHLYGTVGPDDATKAYSESNVTLSNNIWSYVSMTWDNSTNIVKLFINGKETSSYVSQQVGTVSTVTATKFIVGTQNFNNNFFSGFIDEVKLYNYALSSDEIKTDYNQNSSFVFGSTSQTIGGTTTSTEYCIPGDASTCSAPVAEWKFDEGLGTTAYDTSGNNNNGVFGSGSSAPTWTMGKIGKALSFDGVTQYVDGGTSPSLNMGLGNYTMEGWAKTFDDPNNYGNIIGKGSWNAVLGYGIVLDYAGSNCFRAYLANNGNLDRKTTNIYCPTNNTWHHYAVTYNRSGNMSFFVDGVLLSAIDISSYSAINFTNTTSLWAGRYDSWFSKMNLDQLRIYNYARTPAQIAYDYNKGKPVGWWKFDECQGSVAYDSSGIGNTGIISIGTSGTQNSLGTCAVGTSAAWTNGNLGKVGNSLSFDGTDDYVDVTNNNSLKFGSNDFTVSFWTYRTAVGANSGTYISKGTYTVGIDCYDNIFRVNTSGGELARVGLNATLNQWQHHLFVVSQNSTPYIKHYINGVFNNTSYSAPGNLGTFNSDNSNLRIGYSNAGGVNRYFTGQLDDIRIYNYALTTEQVKQVYNGGAVNFQ